MSEKHFSVMGTVSKVEFNWSAVGCKGEELDGKSDMILSLCSSGKNTFAFSRIII